MKKSFPMAAVIFLASFGSGDKTKTGTDSATAVMPDTTKAMSDSAKAKVDSAKKMLDTTKKIIDTLKH